MTCARRSPPSSGAATSLKTQPDELDEAAKREMIGTIQEEAERLNRFIGNLLDMTRLESGAVVAAHQHGRSVGDRRQRPAAGRPRSWRPSRRGAAAAGPADAEARCRAVRAGAVQPAGQCRQIRAARLRHPPAGATAEGAAVRLEILDEGEGIPAADRRAHLRQILSRPCRPTGGAPAPAWASPSAAASSRRWAATSSPATAPDRPGAVFTITLPVPVQPASPAGRRRMTAAHAPRCACWSSTTSRRSAASCAPASSRRAIR